MALSIRRDDLKFIIPALGIVMLVVVLAPHDDLQKNESPDRNLPKLDRLRDQLSVLTTKQLKIKPANPSADTGSLDVQIAELRKRLEPLEADEQRANERRERQKAEEERQKAEAAALKAEQEFQRKCGKLKEKKIADLTVNDVEELRECGVHVNGLPIR